MVRQFLSKWMDIKSEMKERENIVCCSTVKGGATSENICPTMVSFEASAVDESLLEILKGNLVKAESQICAHSSSLISINIKCIQIKIKPHDLYHLQQLQDDISSGLMVSRIASLLQKSGIPEYNNMALVLTADLFQIDGMRKQLETMEQTIKSGTNFYPLDFYI